MRQDLDFDVVAWQAISVLSLPATDLVCKIKEWRFVSDAEDCFDAIVSSSLKDVAQILFALKNNFLDSADLPEESALVELVRILNLMFVDSLASTWTMDAIQKDPIWRLVRRLSSAVLREANLELSLPAKWFPVEEIVDDS